MALVAVLKIHNSILSSQTRSSVFPLSKHQMEGSLIAHHFTITHNAYMAFLFNSELCI